MELHEQVAQIKSRADLVAFIEVLSNDLKSNRESWENPTLEQFLPALASWIEDMDGYYGNQGRPIPEEPSWRNIGEMLTAARIYE